MVAIAEARRKRDDVKKLLLDGTDPSAKRKEDKIIALTGARTRFGLIAEEYIERLRERSAAPATITRAKISGVQASPRGLRHGFAVSAILAGVPLNIEQKWQGHATIATTAIYANGVGAEERELVMRLWMDG